MTIFEAIKIADNLEQAALTTLETWWESYLREYERQAGLVANNVQPLKHGLPKSWLLSNQLDAETRDRANLPAIVVLNPGMSGRNTPKQEGDGTFRVWWSLAVGVFVSANTRADTMKLVREYTAIARTIMLQKQSLGGFADGTTWLDESYDDNFPFSDDQTISAGQAVFEIEVAGVVNRFAGPVGAPDPVTQPGSSWPLATYVHATVEMED